ncbi:MaoC family dehydratase [Neolewinella litorea]|uniref:MaoC family dehydratase n=1 Tax=Neolewinella litorea TaxID=2562452 RepID=UPI001B3BE8B2|nr:MaoC family dehydratase [Neolewinella litorea]
MTYQIGKETVFSRVFTEEDVYSFAQLSGDNNPVHLDADYAAGSIFKRRIVHGFFVASTFSKIFGTIFPGKGSIYLSQTLKFIAPVYLNEEVSTKTTLIEFDSLKRRGIFKTECFNEKSELVLTGEAKIIFPYEE